MTIAKQEPEIKTLWPGVRTLSVAMATEDWAEYAACKGMDFLWDPPAEGETYKNYPPRAAYAAAYCWWECPVRARCQAYAAERTEHGVWGGYWHTGRRGQGTPIAPAPRRTQRPA